MGTKRKASGKPLGRTASGQSSNERAPKRPNISGPSSKQAADDDEDLYAIKPYDLTQDYFRTNTLDPGGDGGTGGFNGGVFVVKRLSDDLVCVEKRMRAADVVEYRHQREIFMLRRLRHRNIVAFVDAYELPDALPPAASLYMQYCSLGSLNALVVRQHGVCDTHYKAAPFPEAFVWHVLRALTAALVYLRTGSTHARYVRPAAGWRPILHRDVKADNVFAEAPPSRRRRQQMLARKQAASAGTTNTAEARGSDDDDDDDDDDEAMFVYPHVVLGDFGHAMYAPPAADAHTARLGTTLTFRRPAEVPQHDLRGRTDVWFAGAVAKFVARLQHEFSGEGAAYNDVQPAGAQYSPQLNRAIAAAMEPDVDKRPDACGLFRLINKLHDKARPELKPIPEKCPECERERPMPASYYV